MTEYDFVKRLYSRLTETMWYPAAIFGQEIAMAHVKSGPGEGRIMCSEAPPSAAGTEGYAVSIAANLDSVAESGLKGGEGTLPDRNGFLGANEQAQPKAVGK